MRRAAWAQRQPPDPFGHSLVPFAVVVRTGTPALGVTDRRQPDLRPQRAPRSSRIRKLFSSRSRTLERQYYNNTPTGVCQGPSPLPPVSDELITSQLGRFSLRDRGAADDDSRAAESLTWLRHCSLAPIATGGSFGDERAPIVLPSSTRHRRATVRFPLAAMWRSGRAVHSDGTLLKSTVSLYRHGKGVHGPSVADSKIALSFGVLRLAGCDSTGLADYKSGHLQFM